MPYLSRINWSKTMNAYRKALLPVILLALPLAALADPWKDESRHGRGRGHGAHEYKEKYWDGHCKVERKLKKNGDYKEKRKCKAAPAVHYQPVPVYAPPPPLITVDPGGVTVQGSVRISGNTR